MITAATTLPTASDADLLRAYARRRDANAFAELVHRHATVPFAAARRVTGNVHDAEDVTQACFLELAQRAGEVRMSVAGWLHTAATRRAMDLVRSKASRRRRERVRPIPDSRDWAAIEPRIDHAIANLPDDLRAPLILHYLERRPQAEVAQQLGIDQSTVSRRLTKAVEQLRAMLATAPPAAVLAALLSQNAALAAPARLIASLTKIGVAGVGGATTIVGVKLALLATIILLPLSILAALSFRTFTPTASPSGASHVTTTGASTTLVIKQIPPVTLLYDSAEVTDGNVVPARDRIQAQVRRALDAAGLPEPETWIFVYRIHDPAPPGEFPRRYTVEIGVEVPIGTPASHGCSVSTLAGGAFASLSHEGPIDSIGDTYRELHRLAATQGLRLTGRHERDIYRGETRAELLTQLEMDGAGFFDAVQRGDADRVRELLDASPELVRVTDNAGMTGLLHAHRDDRLTVAELLIERGSELEAVDEEHGDTPLGWAVFYGQVEAARFFLARGANVHHTLKDGQSLLSLALHGEHGRWREWSSATPEQYRAVADLLRQHGGTE